MREMFWKKKENELKDSQDKLGTQRDMVKESTKKC